MHDRAVLIQDFGTGEVDVGKNRPKVLTVYNTKSFNGTRLSRARGSTEALDPLWPLDAPCHQRGVRPAKPEHHPLIAP